MKTVATIKRDLTIREFDLLFLEGSSPEGEENVLSKQDWHWLSDQSASDEQRPAFFRPIFRHGFQALQALKYVGSIETPGGTRIEILPKLTDLADNLAESRGVLLKMLGTVLNLKTHSWREGSLSVLKKPLNEYLIELFLTDLETLVKKGLRSSYVLQAEERTFLKGRLRIEKQLNRRPGLNSRFDIEHHDFLPNRPENRLIHAALLVVARTTREPNSQRRIRSLRFLFAEIPPSTKQPQDFRNWSTDRSLISYRELKTWCQLILGQQSPLFLAGHFSGLSFLFPMEVLFEQYVAAILTKKIKPGLRLVAQPARHSLVSHLGAPWFQLRPDLIIEDANGSCQSVLDTKWKKLDQNLPTTKDKYNLAQSDFYQMAAYATRYLGGTGEMYLIYPGSSDFNAPLPPFHFTEQLRLRVVPFDLRKDEIQLPFLHSFPKDS